MVPIITPTELRDELASPNPPILVDVREADELEISEFPKYIHIPMGEFAERMSELQPNANLVIVCRTGNRSGRVAAYMLQAGYERVRNLAGGINGWAAQVDPSLPQY